MTDDNTPLTTNQCPILPSLVDIPLDTGHWTLDTTAVSLILILTVMSQGDNEEAE